MKTSRLTALFKLARPRTWVFAASMWTTAYISAGSVWFGLVIVGVAICFFLTAATNLFNAYTDRVEDSINLEHRAKMVGIAGEPQLKAAIALCYGMALILAWVFTPVQHFVLCVVGTANSIAYSWGLRLKARPFLSLASVSCVVTLPFIAGWVVARNLADISPIVFVFALSFFAYANLKNFPDAAGDTTAGVRTVFNSYSASFGRRFVLTTMLSPYILLGALIVAGVLPMRFCIALPFAAGPFLIVGWMAAARTTNDKEVVHAIGFVYQALTLAVLLLLYCSSVLNCVVLTALLVFTFFVETLGVDSRKYWLKSLAAEKQQR